MESSAIGRKRLRESKVVVNGLNYGGCGLCFHIACVWVCEVKKSIPSSKKANETHESLTKDSWRRRQELGRWVIVFMWDYLVGKIIREDPNSEKGVWSHIFREPLSWRSLAWVQRSFYSSGVPCEWNQRDGPFWLDTHRSKPKVLPLLPLLG